MSALLLMLSVALAEPVPCSESSVQGCVETPQTVQVDPDLVAEGEPVETIPVLMVPAPAAAEPVELTARQWLYHSIVDTFIFIASAGFPAASAAPAPCAASPRCWRPWRQRRPACWSTSGCASAAAPRRSATTRQRSSGPSIESSCCNSRSAACVPKTPSAPPSRSACSKRSKPAAPRPSTPLVTRSEP